MKNGRSLLMVTVLPSLLMVTAVPFFLFACGSPIGLVGGEDEDWTDSGSEPIINPTGNATSYPEAALVNANFGYCSGAVIAPRVAMTAGHCVAGGNEWTVITPYAKDASGLPQSRSSTSAWTDYVSMGNVVNPNTPDVGLIFFDSGDPFNLPAWPKIQMTQLANGTQAINVGRINNGSMSNSDLSVGAPITLWAAMGFPYSYSSSLIIQPGDSGGPVFLPGGVPHTIAAVNSGAGGIQILARTDPVANKIVYLVNQHGGFGSDSGGGGGGGGDPNESDCQITEVEPNQPFFNAQGVTKGLICGGISQVGDEDWFQWSVTGAGVEYDISLEGYDLDLLMWKRVNGIYYLIANNSATSIHNISNGSGTYFLLVWSSWGATSGYRLHLNRSDMN